MLLSIFVAGCAGRKPPNFGFIDGYLAAWTRFAQGADDLAPRLKRDKPEFDRQLGEALRENDRRAPSRVVYYAVVQVGGFIPLDSEIGRAFHERVHEAVPVFKSEKDGRELYFAGDLYFWWEAHKADYDSFSLYEEWSRSDFARDVAIKMYQGASKKTDRP